MRRGPYGLVGLIREAWARVREGLDEGEVARRLARRGMGNFRRPPRAWCLVVRASDRRINGATARIVPERAADARHRAEHEVVLTQRLVRRLCAPVMIEPPGEPLGEVAAKLGVARSALHTARFHGVFRSHYKRFGGRRGPATPLLYTEKVLDPNGPLFAGDPAWNLVGAFLPDLMAHGFEQRVVRVPRYDPPGRLDPHPHDPAERRSRRLPAPPPDYVWYKWKDGVYVGDAADARRARQRAAYAERRRAGRLKKRASASRGSLRFRGWWFVCPGCKRNVERLYCPVPPLRVSLRANARSGDRRCVGSGGRECPAPAEGGGTPPLQDGRKECLPHRRGRGMPRPYRKTRISAPPFALAAGEDPAEPLHTFACYMCHRVMRASLWGREGWNLFVGHVSGGLLYGSEVPRPASLECGRVRAYRPLVNRTAPTRQRVLDGLLAGKTFVRIAREMGMRVRAVRNHVYTLCKQERAADRHELARKLGATAVQPLTGYEREAERAAARRRRVMELMRAGLSDAEIRSRLSIGRVELMRDRAWMYRRHGIRGPGRYAAARALAEKLGLPCPETRGEEMRRRVAELRGAGLKWKEVGKELGVSEDGARKYQYLKRRAARLEAPDGAVR